MFKVQPTVVHEKIVAYQLSESSKFRTVSVFPTNIVRHAPSFCLYARQQQIVAACLGIVVVTDDHIDVVDQTSGQAAQQQQQQKKKPVLHE